MPVPNYPPILTQADWNKKKGAWAKLFGKKTGVGEAMNAAKVAYDKINKIAFSPQMTYKSMADFDAAFNEAKKNFPAVEQTRKQLFALSAKANEAAKAFKSKTLIPKSAAQHAEAVAKEASNMAIALKSLDLPFMEVRKKVLAKFEIAKKQVLNGVALCEAAAPKVKAKPTKDTYEKEFWQKLRTLAAAVAVTPECAQFKDSTKKLSSVQPQNLEDAKKLEAHMKLVMAEVGKIKAAVK